MQQLPTLSRIMRVQLLSQDLIDLGKFRLHEQVHLWNITQGTPTILPIILSL